MKRRNKGADTTQYVKHTSAFLANAFYYDKKLDKNTKESKKIFLERLREM